MPLFWNDLDAADPADTELVATGALRIRNTVDAGKTTTAVEHYETGEHKFPLTEPGTPFEGQIYFDVANLTLYVYSGSQWNALFSAPTTVGTALYTNSLATQFNLGAAYTTILTVPSVVVPANAKVEVISTINVFKFSAGTAGFTFRILRDLVGVSPVFSGIITSDGVVFTTTITPIAVDDAVTAGTYDYGIQAASAYSDVYVSTRVASVKVI